MKPATPKTPSATPAGAVWVYHSNSISFTPLKQGAGEVVLRGDQGGCGSITLIPVLPLVDRSTGEVINLVLVRRFSYAYVQSSQSFCRRDPLDQLFIRSNILRLATQNAW